MNNTYLMWRGFNFQAEDMLGTILIDFFYWVWRMGAGTFKDRGGSPGMFNTVGRGSPEMDGLVYVLIASRNQRQSRQT